MDLKKATFDPASTFKCPEDILASKELSREQKVQILRRWEYDARELEVADEEGMTAPKPPAVTLDKILEALRELGAPQDTERAAPTKQHGS